MITTYRPLARLFLPILLATFALARPAQAEVTDQTDRGFVSRNAVVVSAAPDLAWKRLVRVGTWWSSEHTFSGDAANMTLDPVAGGCFCEILPAEGAPPAKGKAAPAPRGGVEHMRVVFVDRMKALRLTGALGPLQSEAVTATLTITLKPVEGGTRILFEYVVGGFMRYPMDRIAGAVDRVMSEQLTSLAKDLGPVATVSVPTPGEPAKSAPAKDTPEAAPKPALGPKGLIVPRGRIWSLPPSPGAAAPEPAPVIAPLAPIPATPAPESAPAPAADPAPVTAPAPLAAAPLPADSAPSSPPAKRKPRAKPATTPADPDEPSKDVVNSAFDTMLGNGAAPQPH